MSTDEAAKYIGAIVASGLMAFGAGTYTEGETAAGWCGEALSLQAAHYNQQLAECELDLDMCEEEE